jgi:hypothetical protein
MSGVLSIDVTNTKQFVLISCFMLEFNVCAEAVVEAWNIAQKGLKVGFRLRKLEFVPFALREKQTLKLEQPRETQKRMIILLRSASRS